MIDPEYINDLKLKISMLQSTTMTTPTVTHRQYPRVIALAGLARSGKDTVGRYLAEHHDALTVAFADAIRDMLRVGLHLYDPWLDAAKDEEIPWLHLTGRHLMQTLGTEWGRALNPDIWITALERHLNENLQLDGSELICITDCRFDNEAQWVRKQPRGEVWHILRHDRPPLAHDAQSHASESGVEFCAGDRIILNIRTIEGLYSDLAAIMAVGYAPRTEPAPEA